MEINPSAAEIADCIAKVTVGNIEERQMDFGGVMFDYIVFGDVPVSYTHLSGVKYSHNSG